MLQEQYVNFDTARLLKEKGFNEPCLCYAYSDDMRNYFSKPRSIDDANKDASYILLPTQQLAMRWLRTCHCVLFSFNLVLGDCEKGYFQIGVYVKTDIDTYTWKSWIYGDTYEDVYEKAIVYSLENLVTIYDEEEED